MLLILETKWIGLSVLLLLFTSLLLNQLGCLHDYFKCSVILNEKPGLRIPVLSQGPGQSWTLVYRSYLRNWFKLFNTHHCFLQHFSEQTFSYHKVLVLRDYQGRLSYVNTRENSEDKVTVPKERETKIFWVRIYTGKKNLEK